MSGGFLLIFAAALLLHVVYSLLEGRQRRRAKTQAETTDTPIGDDLPPGKRWQPVAALIHGPLFVLACYYVIREGIVDRQLISPVQIGAGLVLGHLIFAASLGFIHRSWKEAAEMLGDVRDLWRFMWDSPYVLTRFMSVAIGEELIWRAMVQPVFVAVSGSATAGIFAVAILFSISHDHFFNNSKRVSLEFLLFAILLGLLYHSTGSLALVIVVHALRDIEIAYLEYCAKIMEWGDRDRAAAFIEETYATPGAIRN